MPTPALTQLPFALAARAWLETRRAYISAKTFHEYNLNINTLAAVFGEMRLQEITGDQVRAYQRMRRAQSGPFGINHECGVLCQIRKRIGLPLEDYQALPLPKEKSGRALSDEQKEKLLAVARGNPNWEAAYLFAMISVNTTAGPKETATLRLKDIDLDRQLIVIQPEGAKNVHRIRPIPLNAEALSAVRLAVVRAQNLGCVEPNHYLFPFRIHRSLFDPTRHQTSFKTAWLKMTAATGLGGTRMYWLRHTAITNLLENPEVSEETSESIAGHISREMKKRYSHVRLEMMRQAVVALGAKKPARSEHRQKAAAVENSEISARDLVRALAKLLKTG